MNPPPSFAVPRPSDVWMALRRVKPYIQRTPLLYSPSLSKKTGATSFSKWSAGGDAAVSRSVTVNMVSALSEEEKGRGLVTCSSGNHGLALSYAAGLFGRPTTRVFVPVGAKPPKLSKIRMYGGEIVPFGRDYLESTGPSALFAEERGGIFIHSHDHPLIIAGQGTLGLEIIEDLPDVESIIVPIGGGGLISGVSLAIKPANPDVRIIGVEPAAAPGASLSFRDGFCHERVDIKPSIADGLLGTLTPLTFQIARRYVERIALVEEEEIFHAMRVFEEEEQLIVEGSAAVGLAAILSGRIDVRGREDRPRADGTEHQRRSVS